MFGIIADGTYRVESIGFSTPDLTSGYVVAIRPIQREADIPTEGTLFGRWTDQTNGAVYWDEVEVLEDETEALLTAASRGELAVWDLNKAVETRVETRSSDRARREGFGDDEVKTAVGWLTY